MDEHSGQPNIKKQTVDNRRNVTTGFVIKSHFVLVQEIRGPSVRRGSVRRESCSRQDRGLPACVVVMQLSIADRMSDTSAS